MLLLMEAAASKSGGCRLDETRSRMESVRLGLEDEDDTDWKRALPFREAEKAWALAYTSLREGISGWSKEGMWKSVWA